MALELAIESLLSVSIGRKGVCLGERVTMMHQTGLSLAYMRQGRSMTDTLVRNTDSLIHVLDLQWSHCTSLTKDRRTTCSETKR